ncbi:uncharacterized protein BO80DRAFT_189732 [Aspergillus ibericus CBS 121593]|uniref:Uncharacterized protein n=1 Tax=Aspergillus ibericus CBS 121593 TaxID=1448316 RepID=A0A395GPM4_9EURO|nr:hypothetical protein BO80DRAFT_189732 [Aspergillus ibericus CBS 121593]RAK97471.1 hypothetical protein BO80DRAFT_189732 [Aspergillus ibericus CBS 121593]
MILGSDNVGYLAPMRVRHDDGCLDPDESTGSGFWRRIHYLKCSLLCASHCCTGRHLWCYAVGTPPPAGLLEQAEIVTLCRIRSVRDNAECRLFVKDPRSTADSHFSTRSAFCRPIHSCPSTLARALFFVLRWTSSSPSAPLRPATRVHRAAW